MTASTFKIIKAAEIAERKIELGRMEVNIDEKLDESIYHGMQSVGKALQNVILEALDDGIQEDVPETWKNIGCEQRQITTCMGTIQFKRGDHPLKFTFPLRIFSSYYRYVLVTLLCYPLL